MFETIWSCWFPLEFVLKITDDGQMMGCLTRYIVILGLYCVGIANSDVLEEFIKALSGD